MLTFTTVSVSVTGVNTPPTPQPDSFSTNARLNTREDTVLDFTTLDTLMANDTDVNTDDTNKLGAIGDIHYVLKTQNVDDDLIVVAGDNLFSEKLGEFGDKSTLSSIKAAAKKDADSTAWYQSSCLGSRSEDAEKKIVARK